MQGLASSISSITSVVSVLLMPNLFAYFTSGHAPVYFPGASFFAASLFELSALLLFVLARPAQVPTVEKVS